MEVHTLKKGNQSLFEWLAEALVKRGPTENELQMPDAPFDHC